MNSRSTLSIGLVVVTVFETIVLTDGLRAHDVAVEAAAGGDAQDAEDRRDDSRVLDASIHDRSLLRRLAVSADDLPRPVTPLGSEVSATATDRRSCHGCPL